MRSHGKSQAHIHPAGVPFDGCVNELFNLGEGDNLIEFLSYFFFGHAEDGAVEEDVFPAGEFRVEAGAYFQETGDAALDPAFARRGCGYTGKDLEEGALPGAVAADNPHDLALLDLEGDVSEGPDVAVAIIVFLLADLQCGIGFAPEFGPGAVQVMGQGPRAHQTEAVEFGEVFNLNYGITHFSDGVHEGFFHPVEQDNTEKKKDQGCCSAIENTTFPGRSPNPSVDVIASIIPPLCLRL